MKKDVFDRVGDEFERIPVIGTPIGIVVMFLFGFVYMVYVVTFHFRADTISTHSGNN